MSVVVLAAFVVGCNEEQPWVRVAADGTVFNRQATSGSTVPRAEIPYIVTNARQKTAFVPACGQNPTLGIERLVGGMWEPWEGYACLAIMPMSPIEVHWGHPVRSTISISEAGSFRIRLPYSADAQMGKRLDAVSSQFDVH